MDLAFENVTKRFGTLTVLDGVSFHAHSGEALGLLGRNGAGKTTSIRILMGVFPADSGRVLADGAPIDRTKVSMGYLPEERGMYPKKKIFEQLVYFARLHGMTKPAAAKAVDAWLDRLGMTEYRDKRLDTLSKGNQQKIQLITALAHDPDVMILDEPFSGLDPVNAMLLKDVVKDEIDRGKTVLFSSHQMSYIEEFCHSIAILRGGKIVLSGSLRDIKRDYPRDRLVLRSERADDIAAAYPDACQKREDGSLLLHLPSPEAKGETMKALAEKYDLDELRVFEPSLNDIFVEYAGDGEQGGERA